VKVGDHGDAYKLVNRTGHYLVSCTLPAQFPA